MPTSIHRATPARSPSPSVARGASRSQVAADPSSSMASAARTGKRGPPADLSESPSARPTQRFRCESSSGAAGSLQPPPPLVIWDLDETLILFNSLITGSAPFIPATVDRRMAVCTSATADDALRLQAERSETLRQRGAALGERMESLIWLLLDHIFDFEQLEKSEYASVAEAFAAGGESEDRGETASGQQSWLVAEGEADAPLRRLSVSSTHSQTPARAYAQGFRKIVQCYAGGQQWLEQQETRQRNRPTETAQDGGGAQRRRPFCDGLAMLRNDIKQQTGDWDCEARRALASVVDSGGHNVLVTATHLVAAFGKLLL